MVSDANPILYACVWREGIVLANAGAGDEDIRALASQCLAMTPPFHCTYSHTAGRRTYSFVIGEPFVYFAIYDDGIGRPQGLRFLERVKNAFLKSFGDDRPGGGRLSSGSFQEEFGPVLRYLIQMQHSEGKSVQMLVKDAADMDDRVSNGSSVNESPLLGRDNNKHDKISRPLWTVDNGSSGDFATYDKREAAIEGIVSRECRFSDEDSGCGRGRGIGEKEHTRRLWRRHVRMVLFIDFVVCIILFGVWMTICKGFKCMSQ